MPRARGIRRCRVRDEIHEKTCSKISARVFFPCAPTAAARWASVVRRARDSKVAAQSHAEVATASHAEVATASHAEVATASHAEESAEDALDPARAATKGAKV